MRKSATFIAALFAFASCMLESENPVAPVFEDSCIRAEITVSREDGFSGSKAAVKSDWVEGDVVFVFFQKAPAPKYLELKYSSGAWTSTGKNGLTLSELGASGKMTAIHLPYGSDAVVGADGSKFVFQGQKYNGVFLQAEQADYAVSGAVLSGELKMAAPELAADMEKYIHLDVTGYAEGHDYTLYQDYIRPLMLSGVSADGVVRKYSSTVLQPVQGHIDAELGIVSFSGILDLRALNVEKDYDFSIDDATSRTLYTRTVENKTLGDSKFIGVGNLSDTEKWSAVEYVDLGFSANPGERLLWAVKNVGATDSLEKGVEIPFQGGFDYEWVDSEERLQEAMSKFYVYRDILEEFASEVDSYAPKGYWRLPTTDEYNALKENTVYTVEGDGIQFSGNGEYSEASIFLPYGCYLHEWSIDEALWRLEDSQYRLEVYQNEYYEYMYNEGLIPDPVYIEFPACISCFNITSGRDPAEYEIYAGECSFRTVFSLRTSESAVEDDFIPEAVDLGLSVKWASCNLGASSPEEYGNYYAWGEPEPKVDYNWDTYKWCNGGSWSLTKYCSKSQYGYKGFTDDKVVLDPEDDAATVALGGSWRMPTLSECQELLDNCTKTWTTLNGVYGRKFTSNKTGYTDNWIFLPAAGHRDGSSLNFAGSYGYYWSSSLNTDRPYYAYYVNFYSGSVGWYGGYRSPGRSVRPVSE